MPLSREQEAGALYYDGAKAVRAGGHELSMVASHLVLMLRGTAEHRGPLWQHRILHDGREVVLDRFEDYLRKPMRVGLGLPSLHFLRQVLKATPKQGADALALVKEELSKEGVSFDDVADRERDTELLKRKPGAHGGARSSDKLSLALTGTARFAARLAARRPDLAERVRAGSMRLSTALVEAHIRKPPSPLTIVRRAWKRMSPEDRAIFRAEIQGN